MLSVIIPTINRPDHLTNLVFSILKQTQYPDELIIVDQSKNNLSLNKIKKIMKNVTRIKLTYILNYKIQGLVEAKHEGVKCASGDIICFLDDDVILESDYIKQIFLLFKFNSHILGCSGVITNYPRYNFFHRSIFNIFHRGIYSPLCVNLTANLNASNNKSIKSLTYCSMLSGGVSSWRKSVFSSVSFDLKNKLHLYEDFDFSSRVVDCFGDCLVINPKAKLAHFPSSPVVNLSFNQKRRKIIDCFKFYKKRAKVPGASISFIWLLFGMFFQAIFESIKLLSITPIFAYFIGLLDGFHVNYISYDH